MKKIFIAAILSVSILQTLSAQVTITKQWEAYHNGTLSRKDISNSLITDSLGNIYITGRSFESSAKGDFTTIKYDTSGNELWKDFYAASGTGKKNSGEHIIIDNFQNIYAEGSSLNSAGDIAVVKYNSDGKIWSQNYTSTWFGAYEDEGKGIGVDSSGNVYVTGMTTSTSGNLDDVYTIKINPASDVIWSMQYTGASDSDYPTAIAVSKDGNCYALNSSYNFFGTSTYDITTIHYDDDGTEQWISRYNGEGNDFDMAADITLDADGNQYVCGMGMNSDNNNDMVVWKQNSYGTRLWTKIYDGTAGAEDSAITAIALADGKVAAIGRTIELVSGVETDAITLMLIGSDGTLLWTKNYTGDDLAGALPYGLTADAQGGIYIAGAVYNADGNEDAVILKYDTSGVLVWSDIFDGAAGMNDIFRAVTLDRTNNIVVTGQTYTTSSASDFITIRYHQQFAADTTGSIDTTGNTDTTQNTALSGIADEALFQIYPNPANSILHLEFPQTVNGTLILFDAFGEAAITETKLIGASIDLNINMLPAGVYFATVLNDRGELFSKRFTVQR